MSERRVSIVWALLAAALYAISSPVSKVLLGDVSPTMMAALLYLGAGLGMLLLGVIRGRRASTPLSSGSPARTSPTRWG